MTGETTAFRMHIGSQSKVRVVFEHKSGYNAISIRLDNTEVLMFCPPEFFAEFAELVAAAEDDRVAEEIRGTG